MEGKDDFVNIAIRIRPSNNILGNSVGIQLISDNPPVLYAVDRQQSYTFDNVFSKDVNQEQIYERMVKPLVNKVLSGYNCTVFAYGQTGTGKTYTIGSDPETYEDAGFILRTLDEFFVNQEEHKEVDIFISFFEIYNEKVFDLLNNNNKAALTVKGFKIQGLTQEKVNDSYEARNLLKLGSKNRHTGETKQNRNSSRSHAIFTINCKVKHENFETEAKFNLVDLAGSENARKTGNEGSQFQESVSINKGLFYVGRVISALSTNMTHIPYRQSMITTILRDSLSKTNFITLVACVSPDSQDSHETIQTLEFAQGAKKLRNKPEVINIIQQYKKDNPNLFERPLLGSAVKAKTTPFKRQNHSMECFSTPNIIKKPKLVNNTWTPLTTITESMANHVDPVITPPSLFTPFSPIVRKCAKTIQNTMMEKLEIFMRERLQASSPDQKHTPQFVRKLESTVTEIVRSEIVQLTSRRVRACSSPVNIHDTSIISGQLVTQQDSVLGSSVVAKRLEFGDELDTDRTLQADAVFKIPGQLVTQQDSVLGSSVVAKRLEFGDVPNADPTFQADAVFKIPVAPTRNARKKKKGNTGDITVSGISMISEDDTDGPSTSTSFKSAPRRSTRLSVRKSPEVVTLPVKRRRSVRLSMKKDTPPQPLPRKNTERSEVPTPAPRKRMRKQSETENDPMLNHNKHILNILNTGSEKDLQKLPLIGLKTASQICLYRRLYGQFNSIADLAKMESWRGSGYQRFLKANFIKLEDDN